MATPRPIPRTTADISKSTPFRKYYKSVIQSNQKRITDQFGNADIPYEINAHNRGTGDVSDFPKMQESAFEPTKGGEEIIQFVYKIPTTQTQTANELRDILTAADYISSYVFAIPRSVEHLYRTIAFLVETDKSINTASEFIDKYFNTKDISSHMILGPLAHTYRSIFGSKKDNIEISLSEFLKSENVTDTIANIDLLSLRSAVDNAVTQMSGFGTDGIQYTQSYIALTVIHELLNIDISNEPNDSEKITPIKRTLFTFFKEVYKKTTGSKFISKLHTAINMAIVHRSTTTTASSKYDIDDVVTAMNEVVPSIQLELPVDTTAWKDLYSDAQRENIPKDIFGVMLQFQSLVHHAIKRPLDSIRSNIIPEFRFVSIKEKRSTGNETFTVPTTTVDQFSIDMDSNDVPIHMQGHDNPVIQNLGGGKVHLLLSIITNDMNLLDSLIAMSVDSNLYKRQELMLHDAYSIKDRTQIQTRQSQVDQIRKNIKKNVNTLLQKANGLSSNGKLIDEPILVHSKITQMARIYGCSIDRIEINSVADGVNTFNVILHLSGMDVKQREREVPTKVIHLATPHIHDLHMAEYMHPYTWESIDPRNGTEDGEYASEGSPAERVPVIKAAASMSMSAFVEECILLTSLVYPFLQARISEQADTSNYHTYATQYISGLYDATIKVGWRGSHTDSALTLGGVALSVAVGAIVVTHAPVIAIGLGTAAIVGAFVSKDFRDGVSNNALNVFNGLVASPIRNLYKAVKGEDITYHRATNITSDFDLVNIMHMTLFVLMNTMNYMIAAKKGKAQIQEHNPTIMDAIRFLQIVTVAIPSDEGGIAINLNGYSPDGDSLNNAILPDTNLDKYDKYITEERYASSGTIHTKASPIAITMGSILRRHLRLLSGISLTGNELTAKYLVFNRSHLNQCLQSMNTIMNGAGTERLSLAIFHILSVYFPGDSTTGASAQLASTTTNQLSTTAIVPRSHHWGRITRHQDQQHYSCLPFWTKGNRTEAKTITERNKWITYWNSKDKKTAKLPSREDSKIEGIESAALKRFEAFAYSDETDPELLLGYVGSNDGRILTTEDLKEQITKFKEVLNYEQYTYRSNSEISATANLPVWISGTEYKLGTRVNYQGGIYECVEYIPAIPITARAQIPSSSKYWKVLRSSPLELHLEAPYLGSQRYQDRLEINSITATHSLSSLTHQIRITNLGEAGVLSTAISNVRDAQSGTPEYIKDMRGRYICPLNVYTFDDEDRGASMGKVQINLQHITDTTYSASTNNILKTIEKIVPYVSHADRFTNLYSNFNNTLYNRIKGAAAVVNGISGNVKSIHSWLSAVHHFEIMGKYSTENKAVSVEHRLSNLLAARVMPVVYLSQLSDKTAHMNINANVQILNAIKQTHTPFGVIKKNINTAETTKVLSTVFFHWANHIEHIGPKLHMDTTYAINDSEQSAGIEEIKCILTWRRNSLIQNAPEKRFEFSYFNGPNKSISKIQDTTTGIGPKAAAHASDSFKERTQYKLLQLLGDNNATTDQFQPVLDKAQLYLIIWDSDSFDKVLYMIPAGYGNAAKDNIDKIFKISGLQGKPISFCPLYFSNRISSLNATDIYSNVVLSNNNNTIDTKLKVISTSADISDLLSNHVARSCQLHLSDATEDTLVYSPFRSNESFVQRTLPNNTSGVLFYIPIGEFYPTLVNLQFMAIQEAYNICTLYKSPTDKADSSFAMHQGSQSLVMTDQHKNAYLQRQKSAKGISNDFESERGFYIETNAAKYGNPFDAAVLYTSLPQKDDKKIKKSLHNPDGNVSKITTAIDNYIITDTTHYVPDPSFIVVALIIYYSYVKRETQTEGWYDSTRMSIITRGVVNDDEGTGKITWKQGLLIGHVSALSHSIFLDNRVRQGYESPKIDRDINRLLQNDPNEANSSELLYQIGLHSTYKVINPYTDWLRARFDNLIELNSQNSTFKIKREAYPSQYPSIGIINRTTNNLLNFDSITGVVHEHVAISLVTDSRDVLRLLTHMDRERLDPVGSDNSSLVYNTDKAYVIKTDTKFAQSGKPQYIVFDRSGFFSRKSDTYVTDFIKRMQTFLFMYFTIQCQYIKENEDNIGDVNNSGELEKAKEANKINVIASNVWGNKKIWSGVLSSIVEKEDTIDEIPKDETTVERYYRRLFAQEASMILFQKLQGIVHTHLLIASDRKMRDTQYRKKLKSITTAFPVTLKNNTKVYPNIADAYSEISRYASIFSIETCPGGFFDPGQHNKLIRFNWFGVGIGKAYNNVVDSASIGIIGFDKYSSEHYIKYILPSIKDTQQQQSAITYFGHQWAHMYQMCIRTWWQIIIKSAGSIVYNDVHDTKTAYPDLPLPILHTTDHIQLGDGIDAWRDLYAISPELARKVQQYISREYSGKRNIDKSILLSAVARFTAETDILVSPWFYIYNPLDVKDQVIKSISKNHREIIAMDQGQALEPIPPSGSVQLAKNVINEMLQERRNTLKRIILDYDPDFANSQEVSSDGISSFDKILMTLETRNGSNSYLQFVQQQASTATSFAEIDKAMSKYTNPNPATLYDDHVSKCITYMKNIGKESYLHEYLTLAKLKQNIDSNKSDAEALANSVLTQNNLKRKSGITEEHYYRFKANMQHTTAAIGYLGPIGVLYPSFKVYFIEDDGNIVYFSNDLYSYSAVKSIEVHKLAHTPLHTLRLVVSNMYGNLTNIFADQLNTENPFMGLGRSDHAINSMLIKPGCKVQVRMGYSAQLLSDTIVFNGEVADISGDDELTITAQCYGATMLTKIGGGKGREFGGITSSVINLATGRNYNGMFFENTAKIQGLIQAILKECDSNIDRLGGSRVSLVDLIQPINKSNTWITSKSEEIKQAFHTAANTIYGGININTLMLNINVTDSHDEWLPAHQRKSLGEGINDRSGKWVIHDETAWDAISDVLLQEDDVHMYIRNLDQGNTLVIDKKDGYYFNSSANSLGILMYGHYAQRIRSAIHNPSMLFNEFRNIVESANRIGKGGLVTSAIRNILGGVGNILVEGNTVNLEPDAKADQLANQFASFGGTSSEQATGSKAMSAEMKRVESYFFNSEDLQRYTTSGDSRKEIYDGTKESAYIRRGAYSKGTGARLSNQDELQVDPIEIAMRLTATKDKNNKFELNAELINKSKEAMIIFKVVQVFMSSIMKIVMSKSKAFRPVSVLHYKNSDDHIIKNNIKAITAPNRVHMSIVDPGTILASTLNGLLPSALFATIGQSAGLSLGGLHNQENRQLVDLPLSSTIKAGSFRIYSTFQKNAAAKEFSLGGGQYRYVIANNILRNLIESYYDGELVIFGDPTIEPGDEIMIYDELRDMFGIISVREVYTTMDKEQGFITTIKPGMKVTTAFDMRLTNSLGQGILNVALLTLDIIGALQFGSLFKKGIKKVGGDLLSKSDLAEHLLKPKGGSTTINALNILDDIGDDFLKILFKSKGYDQKAEAAFKNALSTAASNGGNKFAINKALKDANIDDNIILGVTSILDDNGKLLADSKILSGIKELTGETFEDLGQLAGNSDAIFKQTKQRMLYLSEIAGTKTVSHSALKAALNKKAVDGSLDAAISKYATNSLNAITGVLTYGKRTNHIARGAFNFATIGIYSKLRSFFNVGSFISIDLGNMMGTNPINVSPILFKGQPLISNMDGMTKEVLGGQGLFAKIKEGLSDIQQNITETWDALRETGELLFSVGDLISQQNINGQTSEVAVPDFKTSKKIGKEWLDTISNSFILNNSIGNGLWFLRSTFNRGLLMPNTYTTIHSDAAIDYMEDIYTNAKNINEFHSPITLTGKIYTNLTGLLNMLNSNIAPTAPNDPHVDMFKRKTLYVEAAFSLFPDMFRAFLATEAQSRIAGYELTALYGLSQYGSDLERSVANGGIYRNNMKGKVLKDIYWEEVYRVMADMEEQSVGFGIQAGMMEQLLSWKKSNTSTDYQVRVIYPHILAGATLNSPRVLSQLNRFITILLRRFDNVKPEDKQIIESIIRPYVDTYPSESINSNKKESIILATTNDAILTMYHTMFDFKMESSSVLYVRIYPAYGVAPQHAMTDSVNPFTTEIDKPTHLKRFQVRSYIDKQLAETMVQSWYRLGSSPQRNMLPEKGIAVDPFTYDPNTRSLANLWFVPDNKPNVCLRITPFLVQPSIDITSVAVEYINERITNAIKTTVTIPSANLMFAEQELDLTRTSINAIINVTNATTSGTVIHNINEELIARFQSDVGEAPNPNNRLLMSPDGPPQYAQYRSIKAYYLLTRERFANKFSSDAWDIPGLSIHPAFVSKINTEMDIFDWKYSLSGVTKNATYDSFTEIHTIVKDGDTFVIRANDDDHGNVYKTIRLHGVNTMEVTSNNILSQEARALITYLLAMVKQNVSRVDINIYPYQDSGKPYGTAVTKKSPHLLSTIYPMRGLLTEQHAHVIYHVKATNGATTKKLTVLGSSEAGGFCVYGRLLRYIIFPFQVYVNIKDDDGTNIHTYPATNDWCDVLLYSGLATVYLNGSTLDHDRTKKYESIDIEQRSRSEFSAAAGLYSRHPVLVDVLHTILKYKEPAQSATLDRILLDESAYYSGAIRYIGDKKQSATP